MSLAFIVEEYLLLGSIVMKRLIFIAAILGAALVLSACPQETGTQQAQSVKVGAVLSLEGEYMQYGEAIKRGMDLAVDEINASGGIKGADFDILYEDTKSTTDGARSAMRKLIDEGVSIVIGPETTDLCEVVIPMGARNKIIMISPSASSPRLREVDSQDRRYFFRICATDDSEAAQIASDIVRAYPYWTFIKRSYKRALVLVRKDNPYTEGMWRSFGGELSQRDVDYELLRFKSEDLQSQPGENGEFNDSMKNILDQASNYLKDDDDESKVGAIVIFGFADDVEALLRAFSTTGLEHKIYASSSVDTSKFFEGAADVSEGLVFPRVFDPNNAENPLVGKFVKVYQEKYQAQKEPDLYVAYGYDTAMLLGKTLNRKDIEETLKEPLNFRLHMNDENYVGLTGHIDFDREYNEVTKLPSLYIMKKYGVSVPLDEYEAELDRWKKQELEKQKGGGNTQ